MLKMADKILENVGNQIKMFRKIKKLTIDELGKMINKSKSTVSKYESGEIAIDIETLFDIATALNINIINLVDIDIEVEEKPQTSKSHFWQADNLYMYHRDSKKTHLSYIKLTYDETKNKTIATLYLKIEDINDLTNCESVYQGYMNFHDNILNFNLQNYAYSVESVLMNFFVPIKKVSTLAGLISGLDNTSLRPACYKVILSKNLLSQEEQKQLLQLSKDVIKRLKDENIFRVDD